MGHMKYEHTKPYEDWFWEKNRIELKRAYVEKVDTAAKSLTFADGSNMEYDKLVLAVGSKSNKKKNTEEITEKISDLKKAYQIKEHYLESLL